MQLFYFVDLFKYADQVVRDRPVLMQCAEEPFSIARIFHHRIEKNIQVVHSRIPVDHPLDAGGRFMRDDQIDAAVMLLDIVDRVFQLVVGGK